MTNTTHTPGPWRIVTDGISHWIEIEPNKISLVKANGADRRLIAAAPDMMAALEKVQDWLEGCSTIETVRKEVAAGIAKAKGK